MGAGIDAEGVVAFGAEIRFFVLGILGMWHVEGDKVLEFSGVQHEIFLFFGTGMVSTECGLGVGISWCERGMGKVAGNGWDLNKKFDEEIV